MAEFICRLGTQSGEIVTRVVEAASDTDARSQLEEEGYKVFRVATSGTGLSAVLTSGTTSKKGRLKQSDFLLFIQQFSALLRAGIPVLQSISLLRQRSASSSLRGILSDIEDKIRSGVPLSDAFEMQGIFPRIFTASLLAGEQSGALDDVLSRYVVYLKRNIGIARKLRGALAYPLFLMAAAAFMVGFLVLYIVPRMSSLFEGLNTAAELPTITVLVLTVSTALASNLWWLAPLILALIVGLYLWLRTPGGRLVRDKFLLKIPLVGALIQQLAMAQLARSLSTLISGGITVPDSWDIASQAINNAELRRRSQSVLPMIREGRMFTDALIEANWMPALATDMIGIGESSGSLKEMLDEVANFYDAESEVRLEQLTTLLEPLILVVMAGVVVIILLAIYLPIIQVIASGPYGNR
ncbi:MAG: type II secretion system F family protein [Acidobacteria bacterium]|nr:MAG: type II secretion system F family protein [Acidobacteriota bacterium]REK01901.1 MAG: type II secretion system F family protein [Acidobacteriota bacterium]REK14857.1 MAG: type II secretion system F family protein [Acidobacteriota bacterium]REK45572.1 MAG: type II secretion system F family protein [Acidobacteriota bacterium]